MLHSNLFPYQSVPNTTLQILEGGQEHGPGPGTEDALTVKSKDESEITRSHNWNSTHNLCDPKSNIFISALSPLHTKTVF